MSDNENKGICAVAMRMWWSALQNDRGSRARLRRTDNIIDVVMEESFHIFVNDVGGTLSDIDQLAAVAMVLSHVDSDCDESIAKRMGRKVGKTDHAVSALRFRKIIDSEREDAVRQIIRILPIIDAEVSVKELGLDIFYWGEYTKKKWAREYYSVN